MPKNECQETQQAETGFHQLFADPPFSRKFMNN